MSFWKQKLIKYIVFTLLLVIGAVLFFVGALNLGEGADPVFTMFGISGFLLSGIMVIFICGSISEDF